MTRVFLVLLLSLGATVSRSPFCLGAEHAQQTPTMPPDGNPNHEKPPDGAFCSRSKKAEHSCKCHSKCEPDPNNPNGIIRVEDPKCRAWCFRDNCRCPAECE